MENLYLGREPIIDRATELSAYEILYKNDAIASVENIIANKLGTAALLGKRRAFIKVDEAFLLHQSIFFVPKEFFIFTLTDVELSDEIVARIEELVQKGYLFAIDDTEEVSEYSKYSTIKKNIAYLKISLDHISVDVIKDAKKSGMNIVSVDIDTAEQYSEAKDLGCDWFQGYFFAEVKVSKDGKYKPTHAKILKLYNLLMQDVSIGEITKAFEEAHDISIHLLHFINSGAFHFRSRISSIHHILTLVGRRPLGQWLMLMIYSKSVSKGGGVSPLMLMVKNRIELMEQILKAIKDDVHSDMISEAYFVGVLSLIDVVFSVELEKILKDINTSNEVENALLNDEGILGDIYVLVKAIEINETETIDEFQQKYNISNKAIEQIIIESTKSVNEFENPTQK